MLTKRKIKGFFLKNLGKVPPAAMVVKLIYAILHLSGVKIHAYTAVYEVQEGVLKVLVHELWDGGLSMPGGLVESKDGSVMAGAQREVLEETGLIVKIDGLLESFPEDNPHTFLFYGHAQGGKLETGDETVGFKWLSMNDLFEHPGDIRGGRNSFMYAMVYKALLKSRYEIEKF